MSKKLTLYGRDTELRVAADLLGRDAAKVIIVGPSGIGKSEFLRSLPLALSSPTKAIMVKYTVESSAHSVGHFLQLLTSQILESTRLRGPRIRDVSSALVRGTRDHAWSLATAALFDAVGALFPKTKKIAETLAKSISDEIAKNTHFIGVDRLREAGSNDMLAGFSTLLGALDDSGVGGVIIVDKFESASSGVEDAVMAISDQLPPRWRLCMAVNDEIPEGIGLLERIWPRLSYMGAHQVHLSPLDAFALQEWCRSWNISVRSFSALQTVVRNCQGRPLLLREWVEGNSSDAADYTIWDRLGPYYEKRIRELSTSARRLIRIVSMLPVNEGFDINFARRLMGVSSSGEAYDTLEELMRANFLESTVEDLDKFHFVHDVTKFQVVRSLPPAIRRESASLLLEAMGSIGAAKTILHRYEMTVLADEASQYEIFTSNALSVANELIAQSAYVPAIDLYERCLRGGSISDDLRFRAIARLGLAEVMHSTGYYREGLSLLSPASDNEYAEDDMGRLYLVRARLLLRLNSYFECRVQLRLAADNFMRTDDLGGQIAVAKEENTILRDLGSYVEAVTHAAELVDRARSQRVSKLLLASCLRALARSGAKAVRTAPAVDAAREALDLATDCGAIGAIGSAHLALGEVFRHGSNVEESLSEYSSAAEIATKIGDVDLLIWATLGKSDAYLLQGNLAQSEVALGAIRRILHEKESMHPLEYLHWRLSDAVISYLSSPTRFNFVEIRRAAAEYGKLGIEWPSRYVEEFQKDAFIPASAMQF
ncbi:ATP-binding protein [Amycolatopsis sp. TNS106]|uniref:ATP-binding protein n=1 Tax=Amycolatopsis sp. TNS106 TaxID=2861750 RepID=UPI001C59542D|nr:AAA family ATPase [Amycolatopsis sp. TNS106]